MINMTIDNIAKAVGGRLFTPDGWQKDDSRTATGVYIDSRLVTEGSVFIATKGERVDGHSFIPQVFEKGALAVICEEVPDNYGGACIQVADSFRALRELAAFYRNNLPVRVVGITGSVGKTSTKEFIATVLEQHFNVCKTAGNFNNEVGMPLTILSAREGHEVLVLEMGINHFGEMDRLSAIARPDVMVITNIGMCHLEYLGDRDGVFKAKTECLPNLNDGARVILNGDDDKLVQVDEVMGRKPVFFTRMSDKGDYRLISARSLGLRGSRAKLAGADGGTIDVRIPLPGEHMISNALAAFAVGEVMGLGRDEISKGIEAVKATNGRSNIIDTGNLVLIDDCYNANPVSMKAAIDLLATADTRRVAVLGDMFELGEEEALMHEEMGRYAADKGIELIIAVGSLSENIYKGAVEAGAGDRVRWYADNAGMIAEVKSIFNNGDSVLVKASHGMHFEEILEELKKF